MRLVHKAAKLARRGGFLILLKSISQRFFYRRWKVRLFAANYEITTSIPVCPNGFQFEMWEARTPLTKAAEAALSKAGAMDLWTDLDKEDHIYVLWAGEQIASFGAVFAKSPQRTVLGLPTDAKLIGGCVTLDEFRGRSLYKYALRETVRLLRRSDTSPIFVEVVENNHSSIRGVLGAGFSDVGSVDAFIWFGTFVWREGRMHIIKRGDLH